MSNAGQVDSPYANYSKPNPYEVMEAFDSLPFELRIRLANACLDWDASTVLRAYRNKYFSLADIIKFIEDKERDICLTEHTNT